MFGNTFFGKTFFGPTYFGPAVKVGGKPYYFEEEKNRRRGEEEEEGLKSLNELQTEFENETELAETTYKNEVITINRELAEANISEIIKEQLPEIDPDDEILEILAIIEATS